jgi:Domain of unknown function (DUF4350)
MPVTRSRELTFVIPTVAFVAIVSTIGAVLAPGADNLPQGSSFSHGPSGSAAAYLTLQQIGYAVRRSYEPVSAMSGPLEGALLVIANPAEAASTQDRRALQAFVADGGTVLATGCVGATFLSSTTTGEGDRFPKLHTYAARARTPLSDGAPSISMTSGCESPGLGATYTPLYEDGGDRAVLFARIGKGLAVWWSGNTPIENGSIETPGHLELFMNLVGSRGRVVIWDEFYHGQRRSLWSYMSRTPLPWAFAQVALVAMAAGATVVRRRLPIRQPLLESRTAPLEFVETMSALYARSPSAAAAVTLARARLRRLLVEATGLTADVTDARLSGAASPRAHIPADDLRQLLEAADRAGSDAGTSAETALPIVQRLQTVAMALHGG